MSFKLSFALCALFPPSSFFQFVLFVLRAFFMLETDLKCLVILCVHSIRYYNIDYRHRWLSSMQGNPVPSFH